MALFSIKILILKSCRSCRNCSFMASGCRSPPVCHEHSEGLETNMDLNGKPSTDNIVPDFSIGGNEYISAAARHAAWPSRCAKSETPANKQVEVKTASFKKRQHTVCTWGIISVFTWSEGKNFNHGST